MLKVHSILRAALGRAVRWQMITDNPAIHASPPRRARPRVQAPTREDAARLLAAAQAEDPELALYLRLAAVTGARRGELGAYAEVGPADGRAVILVHGWRVVAAEVKFDDDVPTEPSR